MPVFSEDIRFELLGFLAAVTAVFWGMSWLLSRLGWDQVPENPRWQSKGRGRRISQK